MIDLEDHPRTCNNGIPYPCGDDPIGLAQIFQMGWFNHQLDIDLWISTWSIIPGLGWIRGDRITPIYFSHFFGQLEWVPQPHP